mmetsp:Transcript_23008/g.33904  ORF Transcript_23008/g.33904 Transcript_23008/m.33904 type:complete len:91 (+) Transcript_23008:176-448(+)
MWVVGTVQKRLLRMNKRTQEVIYIPKMYGTKYGYYKFCANFLSFDKMRKQTESSPVSKIKWNSHKNDLDCPGTTGKTKGCSLLFLGTNPK